MCKEARRLILACNRSKLSGADSHKACAPTRFVLGDVFRTDLGSFDYAVSLIEPGNASSAVSRAVHRVRECGFDSGGEGEAQLTLIAQTASNTAAPSSLRLATRPRRATKLRHVYYRSKQTSVPRR